jgi:23S rRNA pseudouridine2605 synthase
MEEKKRRPRIHKPDTGFSLQERPKPFRSEESETRDENTETKKNQEDRNESGGYERKPWQDRSQEGSDRPFQQNRDRKEGGGYERKPWQDRSQGGGNDRPYQQNREGGGGYERKPWQDRSQGGGNDRPYQQNREGGGGYERKPWQDRSQGGGNDRPYQQNREGGGGYERKPWQDRSQGGGNDRPYQQNREGGGYERKPWQDRNQGGGNDRPYQNREGGGGGYERRPYNNSGGGYGKKPFGKKPFRKKEDFYIEPQPKPELPSGEGMPLNKYLAHCGISSRRKAVEFIEQGLVTVNGEVKSEPYYRIQAGDVVMCDGKSATVQERMVYVLLNKPKNVITTTEDDRGRNTVLDIVDPHFPERLFPVGRLDRDTTGLILITNDGDLAQKLSHPSHNIQKQYRVGLRRPLTQADFEQLERGVELEDGLMEVNWIRFSEDHPERDIVELEISSGRNRIVRRLFEHLGYEIFKLDRFYFAGLTKKELPRGAFRELTQREIIMLKHFTGHPKGAKQPEETDATDTDDVAAETDDQG